MYHQSLKSKFTLEDFIASHKQILSEKEGNLKFLKRALADLNLNHHSIPLPLSIFNHTSKELNDPSDEETPDDPDKVEHIKVPTPDYDESCYFLSKLGQHEEQRRRYAEERRKEYNEYLKEAKFATSRIKLLERKAEAARMGSPHRSYAELLEEKRANEKAYRSMNDHHITTEGTSYEPDFFGYQAKRHRDSGFDILNWQTKYPGNDVEPLVPKNRLLATHSSRVKASQYKEELMKQIEDKHRREEERLRREKEEELLIEKRLNEQRLRLLKEFEDEQRQQKLKADSLARKQEIIKEMISDKKTVNRSSNTERHEVLQNIHVKPDRKPVATAKPKLPRSPSYLHVRHPKSPGNRKSRLSLESRLIQEEITAMTSPSSIRTSTRLDKVSQSPVKNSLGGDEITSSEPAKYQPPDPVELEKINFSAQIESNKNTELKGDRVLTRLSEVRKKMQEDHQRMLQNLKDNI